MFRTVITQTQLTSDIANDLLINIPLSQWNGDVSFVSTLRALVWGRMSADDNLLVYHTPCSFGRVEVNNNTPETIFDAVYNPCWMDNGTLCIINLSAARHEDNTAVLDLYNDKFCTVYPEWHRLEKVSDFFRKQFEVSCFVMPDTKRVILVVNNLDMRKYHYLQCAIFAFLPWYFNVEDGVSEQEMELIESLRQKDSSKYVACIDKFAANYDFKTAKIRKYLAGFESRYEEAECKRLESEVIRTLQNIEDYDMRIADYLKYKRDIDTKLLGLRMKISESSEDSEIMEYFLTNDKVSLEFVNGTTMTFITHDYLTFFDEEMAETTINNPSSYIYRPNGRPCNNIIDAEDMKMLMSAIFLDQKIRIKFCAAYEFRIGERVRALSSYNYSGNPECRECTPNTHIDRYSCMGNYERTISSLIRENNYIMAIEQCIASCKSLNFGDSTVMQEFMRRMYGISDYPVNMKCIELPDGRVVEPKAAIEFLKAECE